VRFGISLALCAVLSIITADAMAGTAKAKTTQKHRSLHGARYKVRAEHPPLSAAGRLVSHPAFNIACQTRDRAIRALPCDQPVWVYGSPCEIDLGLGLWRNCD
jgi:hypothetical protein